MIKIDLPYPPSINHQFSYYRGRPILSKDARVYRQVVRQHIRAAEASPMLGPLAVRIDLHPPDNRRRDCDNAQKAILDALQQAGAFVDDSQIVWLLTVKLNPVPGGHVTVTIKSVEQGATPSELLTPEGNVQG